MFELEDLYKNIRLSVLTRKEKMIYNCIIYKGFFSPTGYELTDEHI